MRTFLILARYASRTVYEEALDNIAAHGSLFWPRNLLAWWSAWSRHAAVEMKLSGFEAWLKVRVLLGMRRVDVADSFRE